MKNKKLILLIILLVLIVVTISIIVLLTHKDPKNFDAEQVIKYLEKKGYTFDAYKIENKKTGEFAHYISIKKNNIELLWDDLTSTNSYDYYYRNSNLNTSWADISDNNNNDDERKEQKQDFLKWCEEIKLTRKQICNMLDYYYKHNTNNFRIKQNTL